MSDREEFQPIVAAIVTRTFAQQGVPSPADEDLVGFTTRLARLVARRGLPKPLGPSELGAPGGMSDEIGAPLVDEVRGALAAPLWADLARQFVKACFYPEFRLCRDSFREVSRDGACRRQELARARARISGSHCVDCPHWVALPPDEHAAYLAREWRGDPALWAAHRDVFLPEDFRALRQWLHDGARRPAP